MNAAPRKRSATEQLVGAPGPEQAVAAGASAQRPRPKKQAPRAWVRFKWSVRLGLLLLVVIAIMVGADAFFYFPSQRIWNRPEEFGLACEDVWFESADGVRLHGWWLPAEGAPRGTLLHFHGNAENISAHLVLVEWLPRAGYNVLMFDYRGYGRSAGRVTRAGTIRDGHAAVDYALARPDVNRDRLFAYGQSLGGAVAVVVAAERPELRAVVAESTFGSYRRIAALKLCNLAAPPWLANGTAAMLISDGHDPIDVVRKIAPRPLLVITGGRDTICEAELGRELYDAAAEPKDYWFVPDGEHLGLLEAQPQALRERILACFERSTGSAREAGPQP